MNKYLDIKFFTTIVVKFQFSISKLHAIQLTCSLLATFSDYRILKNLIMQ